MGKCNHTIAKELCKKLRKQLDHSNLANSDKDMILPLVELIEQLLECPMDEYRENHVR